MSKKFKEKVGEELYNKILETGIKEDQFDFLDNYVVKDNYIPRQRFNEVNDKLKATEEKVTTFETQLLETKKLLDSNDEYKTKYSELEEKFNIELSKKDKQISNVLKKSLVKEKLISNGAKHHDLLLTKVDFDAIEIKDEKLFGFDKQFETIKTNYDDLFIKKEVKPSNEPPSGANDGENDNNGGKEFNPFSSFI